MALVSGPGRGGPSHQLPDELVLVVEKHVEYIKTLDTVSRCSFTSGGQCSYTDSAKMSWSIG